jgi:hypothetical protein
MYAAKAPARRRANAVGMSYPFAAPVEGLLEEPEDVVVFVAVEEPLLLPPEVLLLPALRVGVPPLVLSTPPVPGGTLGETLPEADPAAVR